MGVMCERHHRVSYKNFLVPAIATATKTATSVKPKKANSRVSLQLAHSYDFIGS
jgi:hypothetical protein